MAQRWEQMAEAAGFRKAGRLTSSTTTEAHGSMRLVGQPTMPEGYAAIVGKAGVVILGPKCAYALSSRDLMWPYAHLEAP